jgi:hypothetical protein
VAGRQISWSECIDVEKPPFFTGFEVQHPDSSVRQ